MKTKLSLAMLFVMLLYNYDMNNIPATIHAYFVFYTICAAFAIVLTVRSIIKKEWSRVSIYFVTSAFLMIAVLSHLQFSYEIAVLIFTK